jgi:hypothetical protein
MMPQAMLHVAHMFFLSYPATISTLNTVGEHITDLDFIKRCVLYLDM